MNPIRKILVPTDFSAYSEEAFRLALTLAKATGAHLTVFHVALAPAVVAADGRILTDPTQGPSRDLREELKKSYVAPPQVTVEHEVIVAQKHGAEHILQILDKLQCDMIVMGTHGRTGLAHLLFGSVVQEVVRRARCPVVVVKAPTHGKTISAPAVV